MTERTRTALPAASLDTLFRTARTYNAFEPGQIAGEVVRELYELAKWGPTATNSNLWTPRTFSFVADGPVATLTFRDQSTSTNGLDLTLDNVSVTFGALRAVDGVSLSVKAGERRQQGDDGLVQREAGKVGQAECLAHRSTGELSEGMCLVGFEGGSGLGEGIGEWRGGQRVQAQLAAAPETATEWAIRPEPDITSLTMPIEASSSSACTIA